MTKARKSPKSHIRWDVLLVNVDTLEIEAVLRRMVKLEQAEYSVKLWLKRLNSKYTVHTAPREMYNQGEIYDEARVQKYIDDRHGISTGRLNNWITPHKDKGK